jgi:hypothetical protein
MLKRDCDLIAVASLQRQENSGRGLLFWLLSGQVGPKLKIVSSTSIGLAF